MFLLKNPDLCCILLLLESWKCAGFGNEECSVSSCRGDICTDAMARVGLGIGNPNFVFLSLWVDIPGTRETERCCVSLWEYAFLSLLLM